jgi:two-component system, OmpR family, response regulator VicR
MQKERTMQDDKRRDGGPLVLCIDDDPDILEFLRVVLEGGGYAVTTAGSGEEGLAAYEATGPDLVLCDLMMEEIDAGTQVAKALRAKGRGVPLFMLTSVGDNLDANTAAAGLGLDGILQKPVDADYLLRLIGAKLG